MSSFLKFLFILSCFVLFSISISISIRSYCCCSVPSLILKFKLQATIRKLLLICQDQGNLTGSKKLWYTSDLNKCQKYDYNFSMSAWSWRYRIADTEGWRWPDKALVAYRALDRPGAGKLFFGGLHSQGCLLLSLWRGCSKRPCRTHVLNDFNSRWTPMTLDSD